MSIKLVSLTTNSFVFISSFTMNRVNVACGQAEERVLLTGLHAVADIYCECCKTPLGWKYVSSLALKRFAFGTGSVAHVPSKDCQFSCLKLGKHPEHHRKEQILVWIYLQAHISIFSILSAQEHAFESSQKYKEGKYIIELAHMIKENKWDWTPSARN